MKVWLRRSLDYVLPLGGSLSVDPIENFFDGLGSVLGRSFWGFVAIFSGAALCLLPAGPEGRGFFFYAMGPLLIGLAFVWAGFGAWWFCGLAALLTMLTAFWAFLQDIRAKGAFFVMFTAAVVYYSPCSFREHRWIATGLLYGLCAALYWLLPPLWNYWQARRAARPPVDEKAGEATGPLSK